MSLGFFSKLRKLALGSGLALYIVKVIKARRKKSE
jgi:hypothetical protein